MMEEEKKWMEGRNDFIKWGLFWSATLIQNNISLGGKETEEAVIKTTYS